MRLRRTFPASHLCLSDTLGHHQTSVGMAGLRHKPRHNFSRHKTRHNSVDARLRSKGGEGAPRSRGRALSNTTPSLRLDFRTNFSIFDFLEFYIFVENCWTHSGHAATQCR
jgi:hypothetical protein